MGKPSRKKKKQVGGKSGSENVKQSKSGESIPKAYDKDTALFITMSQELKEEGNKLFHKRDHEGAVLKYEKALKLLPRNHMDVAYLHSKMASCYMQMGLNEYPRAIDECNLALEVSPKYSKALLKRARCYKALDRLDLALRDVGTVLNKEPNNLTALETAERVKKAFGKKGIKVDDKEIIWAPEYIEPRCASPPSKVVKEKTRKKKSNKTEEKKAEDKVVVEENVITVKEEATRTVKLIFGEDIRWAQLPVNGSIQQLRETVRNRFPSSKAVLIKYRNQEGDFVAITTAEELRWVEESPEPQDSVRLYIEEVDPKQQPLFEGENNGVELQKPELDQNKIAENGSVEDNRGHMKGSSYMDNWVIQFTRLFKNHVGFNSDVYLDLHELGMKIYSEAMENTLTSEDVQDLFEIATEKFQEMAAIALFNWGNVHMSRARKRVFLTEDASRESVLAQVKIAYEWALIEYVKAGNRYEEALKIKPDFYEGLLALGQQQFEQAKLSWYYAVGTKVNLETWPSSEVLHLFNNAEDNMERGMELWEEMEEQRLNELSEPVKVKTQLQKMGLNGLFKDISAQEAGRAGCKHEIPNKPLMWYYAVRAIYCGIQIRAASLGRMFGGCC